MYEKFELKSFLHPVFWLYLCVCVIKVIYCFNKKTHITHWNNSCIFLCSGAHLRSRISGWIMCANGWRPPRDLHLCRRSRHVSFGFCFLFRKVIGLHRSPVWRDWDECDCRSRYQSLGSFTILSVEYIIQEAVCCILFFYFTFCYLFNIFFLRHFCIIHVYRGLKAFIFA